MIISDKIGWSDYAIGLAPLPAVQRKKEAFAMLADNRFAIALVVSRYHHDSRYDHNTWQ
jgi:hypothetical protein